MAVRPKINPATKKMALTTSGMPTQPKSQPLIKRSLKPKKTKQKRKRKKRRDYSNKNIFGFASPLPHISYNNLEYNTTEYYDIDMMTKAIFSKDHKYTVEQLKKARLEAGLDQADVAKLLGKTQPHISKIEAGQRRLDITQLKEFAKIYKKDLSFFIK